MPQYLRWMYRLCYHRHMTRLIAAALLVVAGVSPAVGADARSALAHARAMYNDRNFDEAIAAADEARTDAEQADSGDLVAARALLERYRASAAPEDLTQARERLRRVSPEVFGPREQLEYVVGLGEALYFDGAPGAAATIFDSVLASVDLSLVGGRDLLLDWWASAVDQDARPRMEFERHALYEKLYDRMSAELAHNPASAPAAYWSVVAARGRGDVNTAWDAAQAAWVRAPLGADRGAALRGDLDRLVQRAIIPERARLIGQSPDGLREEWEQFKSKWSK